MEQNHSHGGALVPAHNIVAEVQSAVVKIIGAGTIAKAEGIKAGQVKARHVMQQGGTGTLLASVAGKNRMGTLAALADATLARLMSPQGELNHAGAMREVCASMSTVLPYTYTESVRADGLRVVKRAEWVKLGEFLMVEAGKVGKTGKPTPAARMAADATKVYSAIQARADHLRALAFPALTGAPEGEGEGAPAQEPAPAPATQDEGVPA